MSSKRMKQFMFDYCDSLDGECNVCALSDLVPNRVKITNGFKNDTKLTFCELIEYEVDDETEHNV